MLHEDDVLPRETDPPFLSALQAKNDTTNLFGDKFGENLMNLGYLFLKLFFNNSLSNSTSSLISKSFFLALSLS